MQEYSKAKELQKDLHKLKEESRSEIQQLEAKNGELLSEKVKLHKLLYVMNFVVVESINSTALKRHLVLLQDLIYEELKSLQEKVMQEARHRRSLEDEILKLKKALSENSAEQLEVSNYAN